MANHPRELSERHKAGLLLIAWGERAGSAAEKVGLSAGRLRNVACSPLGKRFLGACSVVAAERREYASCLLAIGCTRQEAFEYMRGINNPRATQAVERVLNAMTARLKNESGETRQLLDMYQSLWCLAGKMGL